MLVAASRSVGVGDEYSFADVLCLPVDGGKMSACVVCQLEVLPGPVAATAAVSTIGRGFGGGRGRRRS